MRKITVLPRHENLKNHKGFALLFQQNQAEFTICELYLKYNYSNILTLHDLQLGFTLLST